MGANYGLNFFGILYIYAKEGFAELPVPEKLRIVSVFLNKTCRIDSVRQVVGDSVYEWSYSDESKSYSYKKYEGDLLNEILDFHRSLEGSGAPYSFFDFLEGWQILIPSSNIIKREISLKEIEPSQEDVLLSVASLSDCIEDIEDTNKDINEHIEEWDSKDEGYSIEDIIEFHKNLIQTMKKCIEYKLLFLIE
jgi:hypothetical protein